MRWFFAHNAQCADTAKTNTLRLSKSATLCQLTPQMIYSSWQKCTFSVRFFSASRWNPLRGLVNAASRRSNGTLSLGQESLCNSIRLPGGHLSRSVNTLFFFPRDIQKTAPSSHTLCFLWGKLTCFFSAATARLSESVPRWAVAERCLQPQGFPIRRYSPVLQGRPTEGPSWLKLYTDWFTPSESCRLHNSWNYSVTRPPFWCQVKRGWTRVSQLQLTYQDTASIKQPSLPCWISSLWGTASKITLPILHSGVFTQFTTRCSQSPAA